MKTGQTTACFSALGKVPEESERLTMVVIEGTSMSMKRFSSTVGIGSRQHDLLGEEVTSLRTSIVDSWRNSVRLGDVVSTGRGE